MYVGLSLNNQPCLQVVLGGPRLIGHSCTHCVQKAIFSLFKVIKLQFSKNLCFDLKMPQPGGFSLVTLRPSRHPMKPHTISSHFCYTSDVSAHLHRCHQDLERLTRTVERFHFVITHHALIVLLFKKPERPHLYIAGLHELLKQFGYKVSEL